MVAPLKENQIQIRGLHNLFILEEARFFEASFFLFGNVRKTVCSKPTLHVHRAHYLTFSCPRQMSSNITTESVEVSQVTYSSRTSPPSVVVKIAADKDQLIREDIQIVAAQMTWLKESIQKKLLIHTLCT